nr:SPOR domain-containing protein [Paenibacillus bovis]
MEDGKEKQTSQIKIKLNGVEKPFSEETRIHDWRTTVRDETAATSEDTADEEEFEWILPEIETKEIPEYKIVNATVPSPRNNIGKKWRRQMYPDISKLVFSIILAIVVGLILGTLFLKMMASEDDIVAINEVENPGSVNKDDEKKGGTTAGPVEITIPALTIGVLQGGQFSTKEAADAAANSFRKEDLATTIIEMDGKHYVFIGVAGDLATAKSWESQLKDNGIEVWAKELTIPAKDITFASQTKGEQFVTEASTFKKLANESVTATISGKTNAANMKEISGSIEMKEDIFESEVANSIHSKLVYALQGLTEFSSSDSQKNLINAQQGLLDYMNLFYKGE